MEELLGKEICIPVSLENDDTFLDNIHYADPADVVIYNEDEYLHRQTKEKKDVYIKIVQEGVYFQTLLGQGYKIQDLYALRGHGAYAQICFGRGKAITGSMFNDKYYICDGRHRVLTAKEMNLKVPILVTESYETITVRELMMKSDYHNE